MSNVCAVIQARVESKRLPRKVLADIQGKPMLEHVANRVRAATSLDSVVIAAPEPLHQGIGQVATNTKIPVFEGHPTNVLDRIYRAARMMKPNYVVRITADDPFKDPTIINLIVKKLLKSGVDYVSNTINPTFPLGLDVEAFTYSALEWAWLDAETDFQKEHVTPFIWQHPELFRCLNVVNDKDLHHYRWTCDWQEDLDWTRKIYAKLYPQNPLFGMKEMLALFEREPELIRTDKDLFLEG